MANLRETAAWESGIYQLETTDPVVGGADGISNKQAIQLANRTGYLKGEIETLKSDTSAKLASKRDISDSYSKGEVNALLAPKLDCAIAEATYFKKTDKIDAYTKAQTDEKFALKNQMLGINQTTQNLLSTRRLDVFYENTSLRPIVLYVDVWNENKVMQLILNVNIGGELVSASNTAHTNAATHVAQTFIIPPKTTYKVSGNGALYGWVELR